MAQPKKRPFVSLKGLETGRVTSAGKPVYKYNTITTVDMNYSISNASKRETELIIYNNLKIIRVMYQWI